MKIVNPVGLKYCVSVFRQMLPTVAQFLAQFIKDNVSNYGAKSKRSSGAANFIVGTPGIDSQSEFGSNRSALLGAASGGLNSSLSS